MKMVKSLLLGSAAAFVAVAGAQAADLPVKAKAVEYVKVCSAYGAGFYYIPGTDTCIQIGGFVRFDTYINGTGTFDPLITGQVANDTLDSYRSRARGTLTVDTRTETEYGTLRSYFRMGMNANSWSSVPSTNLSQYFDRAYIQFAGFTAGYTQSFFDNGLNFMYTTPYNKSDKITNMLAYTADFGNGFSATASLEDGRFRTTTPAFATYSYTTDPVYHSGETVYGIWWPFSGVPIGYTAGYYTSTSYSYTDGLAGDQVPDIVGNLRVQQSWGSAQLTGALHQVRVAQPNLWGDDTSLPWWGDYDSSTDQWGYAVGASVEVKLPMLGAGDSFFVTASYADGAINYAGLSGNNQAQATVIGRVDAWQTSGAIYNLADAVWDGYGEYDTATAWSINAQARHFWTPALRSAVTAGYSSVDMPDTVWAMKKGYLDFDMWQVGFNTIWSPVKNLDIGAEILYTKVEGDLPYNNGTYWNSADYKLGTGGSTDLVSGGLRVQRNF